MKRELVWDLPVRVFHALLASSFIAAFAIAQIVDDDSSFYSVHMLLGAVMAIMVLMRLIWGLVGSRYARLTSFMFGPRSVVSYFKSLTSEPEVHVGHNPGSSVAIWSFFFLAIGMVITGLLISTNEVFKEVHEVFAIAFLLIAITHVAGVLWHIFKTKENIIWSMIDGKKAVESSQAIRSSSPVVALVFLAIAGTSAALLVQGYDATTRSVLIPGINARVQLGEAEHGGKDGDRRDDDDDDD